MEETEKNYLDKLIVPEHNTYTKKTTTKKTRKLDFIESREDQEKKALNAYIDKKAWLFIDKAAKEKNLTKSYIIEKMIYQFMEE